MVFMGVPLFGMSFQLLEGPVRALCQLPIPGDVPRLCGIRIFTEDGPVTRSLDGNDRNEGPVVFRSRLPSGRSPQSDPRSKTSCTHARMGTHHHQTAARSHRSLRRGRKRRFPLGHQGATTVNSDIHSQFGERISAWHAVKWRWIVFRGGEFSMFCQRSDAGDSERLSIFINPGRFCGIGNCHA